MESSACMWLLSPNQCLTHTPHLLPAPHIQHKHKHNTTTEIAQLVWTRLGSRGCQLGVRRSEGPTINFLGFKDKVWEAQGFCVLGGGGGNEMVWCAKCAGRLQWLTYRMETSPAQHGVHTSFTDPRVGRCSAAFVHLFLNYKHRTMSLLRPSAQASWARSSQHRSWP